MRAATAPAAASRLACARVRRGVETRAGVTLAEAPSAWSPDGALGPVGSGGRGASSELERVYRGTVVTSGGWGARTAVCERAAVGVTASGVIDFVDDEAAYAARWGESGAALPDGVAMIDLGARLLMPGFVDTHAHAPQYAFAGTAMDLGLLEWLETYTFPVEAKCADPEVARRVFSASVAEHLRHGTTTCSWFATIHLEAARVLARECRRHGMRALVGKVNMDRNAPDFYVESTSASVADTAAFVDACLSDGGGLVTPVVTPRFVPTCTAELMAELGRMARENGLPVQSHLGETRSEVAWVRELHPECASYAEVYDRYGLLGDRTCMAHCIYLEPPERELLRATGTGVAHCANSNFTLGSGVCGVRSLVEEGVKVGLGTDVAGGYSPSMLNAIRMSSVAAQSRAMLDGSFEGAALSFHDLFHLATLGGAQVLGMDDMIGTLEPGKRFDALVVEPAVEGGPIDVFPGLYPGGGEPLDLLEKFLFNGDDRCIRGVFVDGTRVR